MEVKFYKTSSDSNKVDKSLSAELTVTGITLKNPTDVVNPVIIVTGYNLKEYNYVYIPEFNRYYFCTVKTYNNIWEATCTVDVLMSHKTEIRSLFATVIRQSEKANSYLHDDYTMSDSYKLIGTRLMPSGFDTSNDSYILMTLGRGEE